MDIVKRVKEIILKEIPEVIVIYVFGSYAVETTSAKSGLDLAIFCDKEN